MSRQDGQPQIRKLGNEYFINVTDLDFMLDTLGDIALENLEKMSEEFEDGPDEFEIGYYEGEISRIEHIRNILSLLVTEKRLDKIKSVEGLLEEFPKAEIKRNKNISEKN